MRSFWVACAFFAGIPLAIADARLDRQRAEAKCAAKDPTCDWLAALSSLERASVTRALSKRGYTVDPNPWGKLIAAVRVYNEDVFAEKIGFLQFFNRFHVTTKESAIQVELRIGAGELWDQARVNETARRLRDPLWTSVVVVIPVVSSEAGKVDMLVVTRDIWSLRLNSQYTYQQGSLTNLSIALSENNFLGTRSVFAAGFRMDQGAIATGPIFLDNNLTELKLTLSAKFEFILNRQNIQEKLGLADGPPTISETDTPGFTQEGTQSSFLLSKPLFSLASKWGAGISFSHRYAIDRQFRGLGLLPRDCSSGRCVFPIVTVDDRPHFQSQLDFAHGVGDGQLIGAQYEMRRWDVTASADRQWGTKTRQKLTVGHSVDNTDPRLLDSFPGNAVERAAFIRDVLPRNEATSTPFVSYGFSVPQFKDFRNVSTYELAENAQLGPSFGASYSVGLKLLGSDSNFQRGSFGAGWGFPWCRDGLVQPAFSLSTRVQALGGEHQFIDNTASFGLRVVTPTYKWARIVGETTIATRWNDTANRNFSIGSDSGLRGFEINEFSGTRTSDRLMRTQIEMRTVPRPLWIVRVGGVLFYEVGGVGDRWFKGDAKLQLHHDVGVGFRMLIPQTARDLFRFDFAIPLDGNAAGSLRFIAGFESAF